VIQGDRVVIDANVLVAAFTNEDLTPQADWLINSHIMLVAPEFIGIETASALLGKVRRRELLMEDANASLEAIPDRVLLEPSASLWPAALTFANTHGMSAYDALYVVLAQRAGCQLVTDDTQIAAVLREHDPVRLVTLAELPLSDEHSP